MCREQQFRSESQSPLLLLLGYHPFPCLVYVLHYQIKLMWHVAWRLLQHALIVNKGHLFSDEYPVINRETWP